MDKQSEENVGLLGIALQSNSSNYPMLISHRVKKLFAQNWGELWTDSPPNSQYFISVNV